MAKQQISISFKNNTKESEMFKIINEIEDKAGEIKPVLYKYFVLIHYNQQDSLQVHHLIHVHE